MSEKLQEIKSFLPGIYKGVIETDAICEALQPILVDLYNETDLAFNNTFVLKADEYGLSMFEEMLNIVALPEDTLDLRRFRIINRLSLKPPLSYRWLKTKLDEIIGEGKYTSEIDFNNYYIDIVGNTKDNSWFRELEYTLTQSLPCNMTRAFMNSIFAVSDEPLYTANIVSQCLIFESEQVN